MNGIAVSRIIVYLYITTLISSCSFIGERLVIVTDEQTNDFLVKCIETQSYLIGHNASGKMLTDGTFIASSGEERSCGFNLYGHDSHTYVSHPTYQYALQEKLDRTVEYSEDGALIKKFVHWEKRNKQARMLYENGYWKEKHDPIKDYLSQLSNCYISKEYLKLYSEDRTPIYQELKTKYHDDILECKRENEKIRHSFGRSSDYYYYVRWGRYEETLLQCLYNSSKCKLYKNKIEYLPERAILKRNSYMWNRKMWDSYLEGTDKERNDLVGITNKTYLVGFPFTSFIQDWRDLDEKIVHYWLLVDGESKSDIKGLINKSHNFRVFDTEPKWLNTFKNENFVKNCDGSEYHVDPYDVPNELMIALFKAQNGSDFNYCHKN